MPRQRVMRGAAYAARRGRLALQSCTKTTKSDSEDIDMHTLQKKIGVLVIAMMMAPTLSAAVRGDKAAYVGGTIKTIKEGEQGALNLDDKKELLFAYGKHDTFRIPYESIKEMEF